MSKQQNRFLAGGAIATVGHDQGGDILSVGGFGWQLMYILVGETTFAKLTRQIVRECRHLTMRFDCAQADRRPVNLKRLFLVWLGVVGAVVLCLRKPENKWECDDY